MQKFALPALALTLALISGSVETAPPRPPGFVQAKGTAKSDAPMYGGTPQRNMVNTIDKNLPVTWSVEEGKQKNVKWVAELGRPAYGGPVIADGVVYVGTNNSNPRDKKIAGRDKAVLMAFQESDGKFLWQIVHEIPADPIFQMGREEGLCSTPAVEGKHIYYVTPGCEVVCADTSGKVVWTYDMMKEQKVIPYHLSNCSPLVVGDLVMVITGNGIDEQQGKVLSPKAPSFLALNKTTGKFAWQSNLPGDAVIEGQWSNPTLAIVNGKPQVIFPGGDCVLYSFEPTTGKLIWKCDCFPERKKATRKEQIYIVSTPVVVNDRLYVGLGMGPDLESHPKYGHFLCLDVTKEGDVSFKSYDAKAPENKNSALVWAFGGPTVPPPAKGRKVNFGPTISTAAVHDGLVYIPELDGYLHCLDAKTGARYWMHDFKTAIWGSAFYADGKVYIGTDDGEVFVFAHGKERKYYYKGNLHTPTPDDDRKLQPGISMEEGIQSTPVVANGVLYITTKSKLYAIAQGK